MSHGYNFFLFASFLLLTELWYEKTTWIRTLLIGLVFGCIALIRPTNSLVVIVFLLYGVKKWEDFPAHFRLYLRQWPKILSIIALTFLVCVPQFLYWKHISGYHLPDNGYPFVIQLLNSKGEVVQSNIVQQSETITYPNLPAGSYKLKAIEDRNGNGVWDTGNYRKKIEPERVFNFNKAITIRGYWELEEEWEMEP